MISKQILDEADDSSMYGRALKSYREKKGEISCGYCRYHRGENRRWNKDARNWKKYRKTHHKVHYIVL
jgi:hypothetical protein